MNDKKLEQMNEQYQDTIASLDEVLNKLWQILYPGKIDWEYPGQVYNHIFVEINNLTKQCDEYRGDIARYLNRIKELTDQCDIFYARVNMMREEIKEISSNWHDGRINDKEMLDSMRFLGKKI
jgi:hypothetical protein